MSAHQSRPGAAGTRSTAAKLRRTLEASLERLLDAVEAAVADLDALDGDPDLEPLLGAPENPCLLFRPNIFDHDRNIVGLRRPGDQRVWAEGGDVGERELVSEDESAACEDEGVNTDSEPDECGQGDALCNWQDEGDQRQLRRLPMLDKRGNVIPFAQPRTSG